MKTQKYRSITSSALAAALCVLALSSTAGLLVSATASADVVVEWNLAMTSYSESQPPPGFPPYIESRVYAMAHLAVLNAIAHGGTTAPKPPSPKPLMMSSSINFQAAQSGSIPCWPRNSEPSRTAKPRREGVRFGALAARDMLRERANDGSATAEGLYVPGNQPGDYQFTPPFDGPSFNGYAAAPKWGLVTPFAMNNVRHFRAPAPYTVRDLEYTFDFNEIKALGSINSREEN